MVVIQKDVLDWYGNFVWWERPEVFSHPQLRALVPNIDVAIAELRDLYPADVCKWMVERGAGYIASRLFLGAGIMPGVEDLILLGTDLSMYPDWRKRPKLIGELRSMGGFGSALFEVGVQAGLVRAGLKPEVEPSAKAAKAPDFVVRVGASAIAIELKAIREPQTRLNRDAIEDLLSRFRHRLPCDWPADITLTLNEDVIAALDVQTWEFAKKYLPQIDAALEDAFNKLDAAKRICVEGVGELIVSDPPTWADKHYGGGYGLFPDDDDPNYLLQRALWRAAESAQQLAAVEADLYVAVIWGSRGSLPAHRAARAAEVVVAHDPSRWAPLRLDWIVFFNGHMLGPDGRWTIDIAPCRVSPTADTIPPLVLDGISRWGEGRAT